MISNKVYIYFKILLIVFCLSDVPTSLSAQSLSSVLQEMVQKPLFDHSYVGISIYDLTADSSLFVYHPQVRLRPASTQKVATAVAALDLLGTDYAFKTSFYYDGDIEGGTLKGNLYVKGSMDPRLGQQQLEAVIHKIEDLKIDTIAGNIVLDASFKDSVKWGEGWCWDDKNPTLSPLLFKGKNTLGKAFLSALLQRGFMVEGHLTYDEVPHGANSLYICTQPLDSVLMPMLKNSHNLSAEAVFYQLLTVARHSGWASSKRACRVVEKWLNHVSPQAKGVDVADGSGLSLYNYQTAGTLVDVLRYAYRHPDIFSHLWAALPIAGVDGTLKKRMRKGAAFDNVRAKTGTLTGVSSLIGYVRTADQHLLCFAIINQGVNKAEEGHQFQDALLQRLASWSFATAE